MNALDHEISVLKGYQYLLSVWALNLEGKTVEYYAKEALLMSLIEQQDQVAALQLTEQQKQHPEIKPLLSLIKRQLVQNEALTVQKKHKVQTGKSQDSAEELKTDLRGLNEQRL